MEEKNESHLMSGYYGSQYYNADENFMIPQNRPYQEGEDYLNSIKTEGEFHNNRNTGEYINILQNNQSGVPFFMPSLDIYNYANMNMRPPQGKSQLEQIKHEEI